MQKCRNWWLWLNLGGNPPPDWWPKLFFHQTRKNSDECYSESLCILSKFYSEETIPRVKFSRPSNQISIEYLPLISQCSNPSTILRRQIRFIHRNILKERFESSIGSNISKSHSIFDSWDNFPIAIQNRPLEVYLEEIIVVYWREISEHSKLYFQFHSKYVNMKW